MQVAFLLTDNQNGPYLCIVLFMAHVFRKYSIMMSLCSQKK